jgi:multiple sugar transport system substrate-binding protein
MPLLTDTRVIFYRRSWLAEAGVKEDAAFKTSASLIDTLERLQAAGFDIPWALPTRGLDTVYNSTSWVWAAGGSFRTRDGRQLRLQEQKAQAGLREYFELHRFLSPQARALDTVGVDALFREGKIAAALSGPWLLRLLELDGTILSDIGVAPVPGIPFIGGTHLIIWRHTRKEHEIVRLMQYLTSPQVQRRFIERPLLLPSRIDILDDKPFVDDPRYRIFAESLRAGRVLTISYRWAAVEQRLERMMTQLWADLADDPDLDLEAEIASRIAEMSEHLEKTVLASW